MNGKLARRLRRTLAVTIATVLILLTAALAFADNTIEVRTVSRDAAYVLAEIPRALAGAPGRSSAPRATLTSIMTRLYHPGLTVSVSDDRIGYVGRWTTTAQRYDISLDHQANIPFAARDMSPMQHVSFYVARLLGYSGLATSVNGMTVIVQADRRMLDVAFLRLLGFIVGGSLLALVLATLTARRVANHALTPLMTVLDALETFAAGDLTPRLVATGPVKPDDELGRLAAAYNGAIATVDRALAERARSEQQMRQFIADAGHQLQTPLTVVRGFIGILRRNEIHSVDDIPHIFDTMDRQSAIMADLIKKLMLLQTWESEREMPPEPVEVGSLVEDVALPIADAHPGHIIKLTTIRSAWARVAAGELTYAVSNLIDNSLKYAGDEEIIVGVTADECFVRITVTDRGSGMTQAELARIFDRFYRGARRDVPGSGLGLSIAKRAVERAKGTLTVRSAPGSGSSFTITLPRTTSRTTNLVTP